ncbi:extracellular solute-binding protein [Paenibacillus doosanensis]|uniref:extracellular solute-binding protein n=1 Tax=Paenibacillus doosanensis TaxID=1229154 RepID=UPI0021801E73|nr:extracellular solute-binding protein [Paenibacillus doosanensis]MCS7461795.1 extracellular solute-binding protein [Paenibacillus doosanensis]
MSTMKKSCCISMAVLLAVSSLTACSTSGSPSSQAGGAGAKADTNAEQETMNISLMVPQYAEIGPSSDSALVKKLNEKLNIKLDIQWVPGASYNDKISVLAASNSLPDVYRIATQDYMQWRDKNVFLDVKPLLGQYPNLTKHLPEEAWMELNPKDAYYGIPYYGIPHLFSMSIRKDWLDKLNLKMPETIDDFYQVAKAFATEDPDGNGKADTTGFSILVNSNGTFGNAAYLQGAFGLGNDWALKDGKLVAMQAQKEELKAFIGFLRKAYAEGVLDKNFLVMKSADARNKLWNGQSGIQLVNPNEVIRLDIPNMKKNAPGAQLVQLPPPAGPNGIRATQTDGMGQNKVVINKNIDPKKQERILKLLDYMLSDEGYDLIKEGVEGVDYQKKADGGFEKLETKETGSLFSINFFRRADKGIQLHKYHDQEYVKQVEQWLNTNDKYDWPNYGLGLEAETAAYKKLNLTTLNTKWMSSMVRVIAGDAPIEEVDKAADEWLKNGGEQLTKEVNEIYQQRK